MSPPSEHEAGHESALHYIPKDALKEATFGGGIGLLAGTTMAAIQTALTKENIGPRGVFRRYGNTIAIFSMCCRPGTRPILLLMQLQLRRRVDTALRLPLPPTCAAKKMPGARPLVDLLPVLRWVLSVSITLCSNSCLKL
jgi:hypothetical protein